MRMIRTLDMLPPIRVPDGYRLRSYRPGDEEAWARLINAAFATEKRQFDPVTAASFEREYPTSHGESWDWILFAERLADGALAGTTAAWEAERDGRRMGLVHWVAVDPVDRGRRLGEALLAAALHAMRARGHTEVYLNTGPELAAAVQLYERLGFVAEPESHRRGAETAEGAQRGNTVRVEQSKVGQELRQVTHDVIGASMEVHRALGPGLLESAYEECLCRELDLRGIPYERQRPLPLEYKGMRVECAYKLDILVAGAVVVEVKAVEELQPIHEAQLLTYLRLGGWKVGLLINFCVPVLKDGIRRRVLNL
jgi:GxxExxY protein